MATTFTSSGWQQGASVSAFLADPFGAQTGSAVGNSPQTANAAGQVSFTGLLDGTNYVASDGSRSVKFRTLAASTTFDAAAADLRYEEQMPALVAPSDPRMIASVSTATVNRLSGTRVICPRSGTMTDLYVFIGTASGNGRGVVYDTAGATRTKLFDSGSVAITANWLKLGNMSLAVTSGQQFDFAFQPDNATASIGRFVTAAAAGVVDLPTGFWPVAGGPRPLLTWFNDPGSFTAPATLTEASLATQASPIYLMARVV